MYVFFKPKVGIGYEGSQLVFTMGMGNPPWVMGKGLSGLGLGQEVQTRALMGPIPIPGRDPWEFQFW